MTGLLVGFAVATFAVGCERGTDAMTPDKLERQYGLSGAYTDSVRTPDGTIKGTVVPVTLADGRQAQLVIPQRQTGEPHAVYVRDEEGLHPVHVKNSASREEVTRMPAVVERRAEPWHANKRSWEKDALIIGGSAGGGALIGAVAGGKKGAAVGATAGGPSASRDRCTSPAGE